MFTKLWLWSFWIYGIRDTRNLFNHSTDKDYYKPIKTKSAFNGNYTEYEKDQD